MCPRATQMRQIGHFHRADRDYGTRVAAGLGLEMREIIGKAA
jgi:catalase